MRTKPNLEALIETLERLNPSDPNPAATRQLVQFLRICEASGGVAMMEAIEAGVLAGVMALRALAPSTAEAAEVYASLVMRTLAEVVRGCESAEGGATKGRGEGTN